jgi:hypothetical protein
MQFQGHTFRNKNVALELDDLIYRGAVVTKLTRCSFPGSVFIFENGAQRTLDFLQLLYHSGSQPLIEQVFSNIRINNICTRNIPLPINGTVDNSVDHPLPSTQKRRNRATEKARH